MGVSLGFITPRVFAVAGGAGSSGPVLTVQQETDFLSLVLRVGDVPRLVRTKLLARDEWPAVERELGLTLRFIRSSLEIRDPIEVEISMENPSLADRLRTWIELADNAEPAAAAEQPFSLGGTAVREKVGDHRLDPVVNLMCGGVR